MAITVTEDSPDTPDSGMVQSRGVTETCAHSLDASTFARHGLVGFRDTVFFVDFVCIGYQS